MKYLIALVLSPLLLLEEASACYKCGVSYADPHISTYDQNKFQCQGQGDFILSKSLNTDFELQGRFFVPEQGLHSGRNGSSTVGAVLNTGIGGEGKIEVQVTPAGFPASSEHDCDIHYWVNGIRKEFNNWDATDSENGFTFKRRTRQHVNPQTGQRYPVNFRQFFMMESKVILWMSKGYDPVFGCHMNFQACVPCDFEDTHDLVGLFGSPNGDKTDDFTTRTGEAVTRPPKLGSETTYCKSNWCVGETKNSQFLHPDIREQCTADEKTDLDELVKNADDEIKQECEGEVDCITDTIVTGDIEIGKKTLEGERDLKEHDIEEETEPTDNDKVEEDDAYTCTKAGVGSETAFARPANGEGCFLDDGFKRWGWTLELDGATSGSYTYDVYAAAGQCDINKGENVGTVTVSYNANTRECLGEYQATGGHTLQEWQFYCGSDKYPTNMKTGKDTVAPGMYSCVSVETETPFSDTCKVENVEPAGGKIHVIAHAVSCDAPPTSNPTSAPTAAPTSSPTKAPTTSTPTDSPTAPPTGSPTKAPTTSAPTGSPTAAPTGSPTKAPTTGAPTGSPTAAPTGSPTKAPTTGAPTGSPTGAPTGSPTKAPTTRAPTGSPTAAATGSPTKAPTTGAPSGSPTKAPTTDSPTAFPTAVPSVTPTVHPTLAPTEPEPELKIITPSPTANPTTAAPTTGKPTTARPTTAAPITGKPTAEAPTTANPTTAPTAKPDTGCPQEMPESGSPCHFEGQCEYETKTCCDGTTHSKYALTCSMTGEHGFVNAVQNDVCSGVVCVEEKTFNAPPKGKKGSGSGDPHFKTWSGDKYDYHGECDLVLVDHPSFADGLGLRLHIRTTRVKYFSFIESAALQIGNDILEFDNDVENFLINGEKVEANQKHHKTMLGGYVVRRDPKAISIRLAAGTGLHQKTGAAKIDFHTRKNGFPAVIVDGGHTDVFKGSLGLLGDWSTGRKMARDGVTEIATGDNNDATAFALEWQVRDNEPSLFKDSRFPQYPNVCLPPAALPANRLGFKSLQKEAEEACAHWEEDKDDCLFDVIATRDVLVAQEGHIVHVE